MRNSKNAHFSRNWNSLPMRAMIVAELRPARKGRPAKEGGKGA
jgi:hypothetical protein